MIKILPAVFCLFALISGCTSAGNVQSTEYAEYSFFYSGKEFSKTENGAKVFNSALEYKHFLMARAIKKHNMLDSFDFERNSLVVAYLGREAEEGFGLKVLSVRMSEDKVLVTAEKVTADDKNTPQQFIVIPKTDKDAELRLIKTP